MTCKLAFKCSTRGPWSCPNCHSQLWPTVSSIQAAFDNKHARIKRRIIYSPPDAHQHPHTHQHTHSLSRLWFLGGYKGKKKKWSKAREVRVIALPSTDRKMAGSGEHNSNLLPTPACINTPPPPHESFQRRDNKRRGWQCRKGWYV